MKTPDFWAFQAWVFIGVFLMVFGIGLLIAGTLTKSNIDKAIKVACAGDTIFIKNDGDVELVKGK